MTETSVFWSIFHWSMIVRGGIAIFCARCFNQLGKHVVYLGVYHPKWWILSMGIYWECPFPRMQSWQHEGLDRKIKEIRLQMVICSLSCYFSGVYLWWWMGGYVTSSCTLPGCSTLFSWICTACAGRIHHKVGLFEWSAKKNGELFISWWNLEAKPPK